MKRLVSDRKAEKLTHQLKELETDDNQSTEAALAQSR